MYIKNSYDYLYSRSKSTVQYCTVLFQYSPIVTGRFLTTITSRPVLAWKKKHFLLDTLEVTATFNCFPMMQAKVGPTIPSAKSCDIYHYCKECSDAWKCNFAPAIYGYYDRPSGRFLNRTK